MIWINIEVKMPRLLGPPNLGVSLSTAWRNNSTRVDWSLISMETNHPVLFSLSKYINTSCIKIFSHILLQNLVYANPQTPWPETIANTDIKTDINRLQLYGKLEGKEYTMRPIKKNHNSGMKRLRVEQFVALLSPPHTLDSLVMHLLCHFLVPFLLFLGRSTVLDPLDMGLHYRLDQCSNVKPEGHCYLSLGFPFLPQFLFMFLDSFLVFAIFQPLCVRGHTRTGTEWFFGGMPIFTWYETGQKAEFRREGQ